MSTKKKRLDILLQERGLVSSRDRGKSLIMAGNVLVNNAPISKPGTLVPVDSELRLKRDDIPYVSRGGLKLEKALTVLDINVKGLDCLDIGSSTGGFTDCLLQKGARHVFAVDVGYGQLAWKLRNDSRITLFERTNIRNMSRDSLPFPVDMITIDVSFISLKIVVPAAIKFAKNNAILISLIKPQFEVGKGKVGKGGIVRDESLHHEIIRDLASFFSANGMLCIDTLESPVLGAKGNREFFIALKKLENSD